MFKVVSHPETEKTPRPEMAVMKEEVAVKEEEEEVAVKEKEEVAVKEGAKEEEQS